MSRRRFDYYPDRAFQELASAVKSAIFKNEGLIGDQQEQVELLVQLERKFKYHVQKYQQTTEIYKKFIKKFNNADEDEEVVEEDLENILSAQPYFREKSSNFAKISKSIKENNVTELMQYNINYQMIQYIVTNWRGNLPERPRRYYEEFLEARRILIENNLPLAINRAKLFYNNTPKSHWTLMDFIGICTQGLAVGIDKYEGEYTKVWRSVCIGRMMGFMMDEYSKTFLKMYPSDRKILYRTNALKSRLRIEDVCELVKAVNESFAQDKAEGKATPALPISEIHIQTLLNSSSYVSANPMEEEGSDADTEKGLNKGIYDTYDDGSESQEDKLVREELMDKIALGSKTLTNIERKIIRLKGVNI